MEMSNNKTKIKICDIPTCNFVPNVKLRKAIKEIIKKYELEDQLEYVKNGCTGHCTPFVYIEDEDGKNRYAYAQLTSESIERIIKEHVIEGKPVEELGDKID